MRAMRNVCAGLVLAVLSLAGCGSESDGGAGGDAARGDAAYVGISWLLSSVVHDGTTVPVAAKYSARIEFAPEGTIGMSDSVNYLSGKYASTPTGFTTSDVASTAMGWVGDDPTRTLVIKAIDAIGMGPIGSDDAAPVAARVEGDTLVVIATGYELTLQRNGPAPDMRPQPTPGVASSAP